MLDLSNIGGELADFYFGSSNRSQKILLLYKFNDTTKLKISYHINPPTVYCLGEPTESLKELNPDIEFITVLSIRDVPFKYAPATLDDVKNYDIEGNIID
jgi:hypothetical protein